MPTESFLDTSEEELLKVADLCMEKAGSALEVPPQNFDDLVRLRLFLEAQSCLAEVVRRQAQRTAERDRKRENRHFWIELSLTIVITILIGWEIYQGWQQAAILQDMKSGTATTVNLQTETLELLRKQEADRAKKPRLALYTLKNIPIDRATVRLQSQPGGATDFASFALFVKNEGEAPALTPRLHALTPEGAGLSVEGFNIAPEFGPPLPRNAQRWTLQLPELPVGETTSVQVHVYATKRRAAFKVTFTLDTPELQAVIPLGSLTILPPKP